MPAVRAPVHRPLSLHALLPAAKGGMNLDSFDLAKLIKIVVAADELEEFLHDNSGTTADWPVDISADNERDGQEMCARLNKLRDALKPYREAKRPLDK